MEISLYPKNPRVHFDQGFLRLLSSSGLQDNIPWQAGVIGWNFVLLEGQFPRGIGGFSKTAVFYLALGGLLRCVSLGNLVMSRGN
jgi:hypothetical protein